MFTPTDNTVTHSCVAWPFYVVRRGCKSSFGRGCKGLLRVCCTMKDLFCTDPTIICTSAKGFSLSWPKRPSAQSPNHFQEYPNIVTTGLSREPRTSFTLARTPKKEMQYDSCRQRPTIIQASQSTRNLLQRELRQWRRRCQEITMI